MASVLQLADELYDMVIEFLGNCSLAAAAACMSTRTREISWNVSGLERRIDRTRGDATR